MSATKHMSEQDVKQDTQGKEMAANLLSHVENIIYLTGLINSAASTAQNNIMHLKDKSLKNTTHLLEANKANTLRNKAPMVSDMYRITYNPPDLTLIGGAVLTIYDHLLPAFKERHDIKSLQSYMKRRTTDIDMVWWPTIRLNDKTEFITSKTPAEQKKIQKSYTSKEDTYLVIYTSPAIIEVVNVFAEALNNVFQDALPMIQSRVISALSINESQVNTFEIEVSKKSFELAGTHTILVSFILNGIKMEEICQISLHDGGSSQLYRRDGEKNTSIETMHNDPVYCTVGNSYLIHLKDMHIKVLNVQTIQIPSILAFVEQQMFAFGNNMISASGTRLHVALQQDKYAKAFVHFKRVFYLKLLLSDFNTANKNNERNYKTLVKQYIPQPNIVRHVEEAIRSRMITFESHIQKARQVVGLQHDPLLHFLFDPTLTDEEWVQTVHRAKQHLLSYKKRYMQLSKDPDVLEVLHHFTSINETFIQLSVEEFKTYFHVIMLRAHVNDLIFKLTLLCADLKVYTIQEGLNISNNTTSTIMQNYLEMTTVYDEWKRNLVTVKGLHLASLTTPLHIVNMLLTLLEDNDQYSSLNQNRYSVLDSIIQHTNTLHNAVHNAHSHGKRAPNKNKNKV